MKETPLSQPKIRVGVFEEDPLRLIGVRALLQGETDIEVLPLADCAAAEGGKIEVVLIRGHQGRTLRRDIETIQAGWPYRRILISGSGLSQDQLIEALVLGAKGYISENTRGNELAQAIRSVYRGIVWAPRSLLAAAIERIITSSESTRLIRRAALTQREKQVLELLVTGSSNKEIAVPLGIEVRTVKAHVSRLMRKFGAKNRIAVSIQAVQSALVTTT